MGTNKKIHILFALLTFSLLSCKQSATSYVNKVVEISNKLTDSYQPLMISVAAQNFKRAEEERVEALAHCQSAEDKLKKLGSFNGDAELQKAALTYCDVLKNMANNELKEIIQLSTELANSVNSASVEEDFEGDNLEAMKVKMDRVNELTAMIDIWIDAADKKLTIARRNFLRSNHLKDASSPYPY